MVSGTRALAVRPTLMASGATLIAFYVISMDNHALYAALGAPWVGFYGLGGYLRCLEDRLRLVNGHRIRIELHRNVITSPISPS